MTRYHRSGPAGAGPAHARNRKSSRKRFNRMSIAVLDPRKLVAGKPAPAPRAKRKGQRQSLLRRLYASRDWHSSHALALILLVAALFVTGYGFLNADFWVYSAVVSNNRHTSSEEIYREAGIHGFSIFFIDPAQVADRLKQLPHVQDVRVQVRLPAQVRIRVQEREPIILYQIQGDSYWIDAEGVIMSAVEDRTGLVKLIDDDQGGMSDKRHIEPGLLQAIQYVTGTIPEVKTFRYQEPYGLFFISPEGWRVYLGSTDNMDAKLATWEAMRTKILQNNYAVQEIDVRYDRPYWR
jgi:cell division septal protein FtsQ